MQAAAGNLAERELQAEAGEHLEGKEPGACNREHEGAVPELREVVLGGEVHCMHRAWGLATTFPSNVQGRH